MTWTVCTGPGRDAHCHMLLRYQCSLVLLFRYHSLVVDALNLPSCLEAIAWTCGAHHAVHLDKDAAATALSPSPDCLGSSSVNAREIEEGGGSGPHPAPELVMALAHRSRPHFGVQFHPESISTKYGAQLLRNFSDLTRAARGGLTVPRCELMREDPGFRSGLQPFWATSLRNRIPFPSKQVSASLEGRSRGPRRRASRPSNHDAAVVPLKGCGRGRCVWLRAPRPSAPTTAMAQPRAPAWCPAAAELAEVARAAGKDRQRWGWRRSRGWGGGFLWAFWLAAGYVLAGQVCVESWGKCGRDTGGA